MGVRKTMSNAKQEPTPEEKLLALIQSDKRQEPTPPSAEKPVVPVVAAAVPREAPVPPAPPPSAPPAPVAVPVVPEAAPPIPKAEPPPEKKLKLSARAEQSAIDAEKKLAAPASKGPAPADAGSKSTPPAVTKPEAAIASVAAPSEKPAPLPKEEPAVAAISAAPRIMTVRRGVGGLALVNRILALVVLVLLVLVVYSVASIRADVAKNLSTQVSSAGSLPWTPVMMTSETVPALDYYLDKVSRRNLFTRVGGGSVTTNVVSVVEGAAGDLKLVGISMDDSDPGESLAIIRNKVDSKTHFVKVGQTVGDTGLTLARVLADRVILKSHKQEVELK